MGVSNYTPTGISHATSVDFSKRSVNQPVHIVQYDKSLPILAVSLYNNGQLYRLSEDMEVSIRLGKPDRTFVYNKALGCDSTRTIVYFEITQQMSLFDGEYYPVIEIKDGEKIANSSTIYLVVDRNPVQHDYIESTIEYKELINYRDEAVEASETAVNAANSASQSAESILGVEENVTRIGNMVSEKEPIITAAAETASTSATNAKASEDKAKASEEASKLSETNAKESETNAKASEEAAKLSETNAKDSENKAKKSENESVKYSNLSKSYAVGTDNTIRENDAEDNAKKYCETAKSSEVNAKQSETNAKAYLDEIVKKIQATKFEVDFATGELIQTTGSEFGFVINQTTGNLEWEVTV